MDTIVDFLFMFDIAINLNTPLERIDKTLNWNRCEIFSDYLKFWLLLDIFASFPMNLIEKIFLQSSGNEPLENANLVRIARLPRLYKLLRMARLVKILKMFKGSVLFSRI